MFGGAIGNSGLTARRFNRGALRGVAAIFATALIVGACGGAAATASPTEQPTNAPSPSSWPAHSPSILTPSPSPTETPLPSGAVVKYAVAMGKARLATPADDAGAAAAGKINDFGLDLLRRLDSKGNLVASPTSIALALAMTRLGARGTTATEMDAVLRSFGASGQAAEIVALLAQLKNQTIYLDSDGEPLAPGAPHPAGQPPAVELQVANQVFSQQGMTLEQAFLDSLSSSFGAGVGLLDFAKDPESARLTINKWASDNTRGRIPNVLQPGDITSITRIALANAIYLKAAWAHPFDPANTKTRAFTTASGASVSVPTMAIEQGFGYRAAKGYRAVNLPYAEGSTLSMTIIVPDDITSFTASLTAANLANLMNSMGLYDVSLTMPRFSSETRVDVTDVLTAMGMPTAFSANADFSGITKDQALRITAVIHQANIDVVEEGTTAAAVTVVVGGGSAVPPPHVNFLVNKPFLYFIRERESGVILFMGRVDDPSMGR